MIGTSRDQLCFRLGNYSNANLHDAAANRETFGELAGAVVCAPTSQQRERIAQDLELSSEGRLECDSAVGVLRVSESPQVNAIVIGGFELGDTLRAVTKLRAQGVALPIAAVLEEEDIPAEAALLDAGADDVVYTRHPSAAAVRMAGLRRVMRREYLVSVADGVVFDGSHSMLFSQDLNVALTPALRELFELLAPRAGQWVPEDDIVRGLGSNLSGTQASEYVRQRTQALRRALAGSGLSASYSTLWGARLARSR